MSVSNRTGLLDDEAREEIRNRIYLALSRFSPRIEVITVDVTDVEQSRGSPHTLCRLSVRMNRLGSFSADSVAEQRTTAVSRAADRAAKQIERILDRDQTRHGGQERK